MFFPSYSSLKAQAARRLADAPQAKRICLSYTAMAIGCNALIVVISYLLNQQIGTTGGLAHMGLRSLYTTIDQILEIGQMVFNLVLSLGFTAAMLRISRGMYTSPKTLKTGLDRFGPLVRLTILQSLLTMGVMIASFYAGAMLFSFSPLANSLTQALMPLVSNGELTMEALMENETVISAMMKAMLPILGFAAVIFLIFGLPVLFRIRMAKFFLLDHPEMGAMACMRESRLLLRNRVKKLLLLDLRMWWYYLALTASALVLYGDSVLFLLGVPFPLSPTAAYFVFYALYFVVQSLIFYYLMPYVTTVYALCYNEICPKPKDEGTVLGSIFAP